MIRLNKITYSVRWKGFDLDAGDWYGYDENGNPCMSKLYLFGDKISITVRLHGRKMKRLLFMYDDRIPIDIQQILFAKRKMFLEKKHRVAPL